MKRKLSIAGMVIIALVFGFAVGVWTTSRNVEKFMIAPARIGQANLSAMRVGTLSLLRIGATEDAIEKMERMLDFETLALTRDTTDPGQLPEGVLRALKQIKAYRGMVPSQGANASRIEQALVNIPEITDYRKECQAGLCRLLEVRKPETQQAAGADETAQP